MVYRQEVPKEGQMSDSKASIFNDSPSGLSHHSFSTCSVSLVSTHLVQLGGTL